MSQLVTKPAAEINASLIKFLPETDSQYARYPMKHDRWYEPTETGPHGEPCYVQVDTAAAGSASPSSVKKDYVFCRKTPPGMQPGYFSLMTHVAYVNLYEKIDSVRPAGGGGGCCGIGGSPDERQALDEWDDVKRVIWARQLAAQPNDEIAGKAAMDVAKGKAKSAYTFTQNEALVVNAATTAVHLAG